LAEASSSISTTAICTAGKKRAARINCNKQQTYSFQLQQRQYQQLQKTSGSRCTPKPWPVIVHRKGA
jgi:hypothetical protein